MLQKSCTGVSAMLLLRLSGQGCPFKTHSYHIVLAVLLLRLKSRRMLCVFGVDPTLRVRSVA
jgi:hypothetical protein